MNNIKTKLNKSIISKEDLKELESFLPIKEKEAKKEVVPIIYDEKHTRQYSIKIPKKLAQSVEINPKEDYFKFELTIPDKPNEKPTLKGELIRKWKPKKDLTGKKEK